MLPSSLTQKPSTTPSPAPLSQPSITTDDDLDPKEVTKQETCKQHLVSVLSGQSAIGAYPFMLHIEEHVPWEFSSHHGALLLRARKCEDRHLDKDGLCQPCQSLLSNDRFKKVLARMQEGVHEYTPYKYHGPASLAAIARKKERTIESYRTRRVNDTRKLLRREGVITLHRQILLAMSTGKIPHVDRILQIASDRQMSVAAILEMVKKAGQGIYRPKGFKEEEDLQTLLFLRLGGQRVAEIAHCMFGISAPSTVHRRTVIPPLICSASYPLEVELVKNLKAAFENLLPALAIQKTTHVVFMIDEIAQEKRPWWCDQTNKILGFCRKHTKKRCMEFNGVADAEVLMQDVAQGDVHLAHEVSLVSQPHM